MKEKIKYFLRPYAPLFIRKIYRKYKKKSPGEIELEQLASTLKNNYLELNKNCPPNKMVFRKGITMNIHPGSKFGFEHFCFISPGMVNEMDEFIDLTIHKKNLLDIGALHGVFSLAFAINHTGKKAVSVDASPLAFDRLVYNIKENNLDNVIPVQCALSDTTGMLSMHYEWEHAVATGTRVESEKSFEVEKETGDVLCKKLNFQPDVIKIDVEGHEIKVLKGLKDVIEQSRPLIFLELHPHSIQSEGDKIHDLFLICKPGEYTAYLPGNTILNEDEICNAKQIIRIILKPRRPVIP